MENVRKRVQQAVDDNFIAHLFNRDCNRDFKRGSKRKKKEY